MNKRTAKDLLYEQVARIGKALSSPKRLELLEVLAQGEKTVEALAAELDIDVRLASAHLKALREARLVVARRAGKYMIYRLSSGDVAGLWVKLREVADPQQLVSLDRAELLEQARRGAIIVIDVRPQDEYQTAHLPYARSMPLAEIEQRFYELPRDREIVAYCRGPFCLLSEEALQRLARRGFRVRKLSDGVSEWQAAGLPVERAAAA